MNKQQVISGVVSAVKEDYAEVSIVLGTECRTEEGMRLPSKVQIRADYHRMPVIDVESKYSITFSGIASRPRFVKQGDTVFLVRNDNCPYYAWAWCYAEEVEKAKLPAKVAKPAKSPASTPVVAAAETLAPAAEPVTTEVVAETKPATGIVDVEEAFAPSSGKSGVEVRNGHKVAPVSKYRQRSSKKPSVVPARELVTA